MERGEPTMGEALERLERLMPENVRASLRPPVSEHDLDRLRRAADPFDLPEDVVTLLRWADGQEFSARIAWPIMHCGPLCGAATAADSYRWLCTETDEGQWTSSWLPVARAEHSQAGIEMHSDQQGVVIDASFAGAPHVVAPSLAAVIAATAEMLRAGLPFMPPPGPEFAQWRARQRAIAEAMPGWER